MDEKLLLVMQDLAPRETRSKTETRILRLSEFVSKVPQQMVVTYVMDVAPKPVGFGATSSFCDQPLSSGMSAERLKL